MGKLSELIRKRGDTKKLTLPLEYIHQGKSKIYIDNEKTKNICSVTLTPTYRFSNSTYFKVEGVMGRDYAVDREVY
ncbi:hypothetical protein [Hippea maritima]|uniref:Uncharacterized protein n=1 Tax=Hippea maritima (strain ATCC 700847 / DSM 10411 / MH2) TaxID=760142 RepID=F2LUA0_HIPMA|nr:hypothetical protein [Hippea maritima]AEA34563.1 hypothetical protein Hipma_1610 [Hippea maritima DSM 10411]